MAATRISDLILPSVFVPNVMERALNSNALVLSGIIPRNPRTEAALRAGGLTFNINSLLNISDNAGDPNVSTDDPAVFAVPKKITGRAVTGVRMEFNDHFAAMDVAESVTAVDAIGAVEADAANLITEWRKKALGAVLADTINETNAPNLVNTSGVAYAAGGLIDTTTAWGDSADPANMALVMNSKARNYLLRTEIGLFEAPSEASFFLQTYMGMPVIVDDSIVDVGSVGKIIMIKRGAVEFATAPVQVPVETSRVPLAGNGGGETIISLRDAFSYHVNGFKWVGTAASGSHPTIAELALPASWVKVHSDKAIGVAAYTFTYA